MDIHRALAALAAGDALGATSEFAPLSRIPEVYRENSAAGWPFRPVGGGAFGWKPGQATDDATMARALVDCWAALPSEWHWGELAADEFVEWMKSDPPDIGDTTRTALFAVQRGAPWWRGGREIWRRNPHSWSNGSLMRNGVVAALAADDHEAFRLSLWHSLITHWAPLPALCCATQTWLQRFHGVVDDSAPRAWLAGFRAEWERWLAAEEDPIVREWAGEAAADLPEAWERLESVDFDPDTFRPYADLGAGRDGYCLTTLQIGVWAMAWAARDRPYPPELLPADFPRAPFRFTAGAVLGWVALIGRDADTYGATAGPLVAAVSFLPRTMTDGLEAIRKPIRVKPVPARLDPLQYKDPYGRWDSSWHPYLLSIWHESLEWLDLARTLLPPPVTEQDGVLLSRSPEDVVVAAGEDRLVVAHQAIAWQGPHTPINKPVVIGTRLWAEMDLTWLEATIETAAATNLARRVVCSSCGERFPPERMGFDQCHGCMERDGVWCSEACDLWPDPPRAASADPAPPAL